MSGRASCCNLVTTLFPLLLHKTVCQFLTVLKDSFFLKNSFGRLIFSTNQSSSIHCVISLKKKYRTVVDSKYITIQYSSDELVAMNTMNIIFLYIRPGLIPHLYSARRVTWNLAPSCSPCASEVEITISIFFFP